MCAFALAVLILLSLTTPVLAELNFRVKSETVTPDGDLTVNREVFTKLVLEEMTPSLMGRTRLELKTDLTNPVWSIIVDSETPETYTKSSFDFVFDHELYDTITIQLSGNAPSVGVKTVIVLIEVTQVVAPTKTTIHTITRYVTSGRIDEALDAIQKAENQITRAENAIADAENSGVDVTEANEFLAIANGFLESANSLYNASKMNESIAAANNAYDSAVKAYNSARGASGWRSFRDYWICVAVIIAILIIAAVVYQKRRWERL